MSDVYRVGHHQPQNVYRDNEYIGVMFSEADAALIVEIMNLKQPTIEALFDGPDSCCGNGIAWGQSVRYIGAGEYLHVNGDCEL